LGGGERSPSCYTEKKGGEKNREWRTGGNERLRVLQDPCGEKKNGRTRQKRRHSKGGKAEEHFRVRKKKKGVVASKRGGVPEVVKKGAWCLCSGQKRYREWLRGGEGGGESDGESFWGKKKESGSERNARKNGNKEFLFFSGEEERLQPWGRRKGDVTKNHPTFMSLP